MLQTQTSVKSMLQPLNAADDRQTVLIVDDDPNNIEVLVSLMSYENIDLAIAHNGVEAVAQARKMQPDLMLLDVTMPGMTGYEVCKALKENPQTEDIAVIFLTGMSESDNEEKGLALGAVDYIAKPFVLPVLRARVRNHLELKRKSRMLSSLARIDSLTHLPNRTLLQSALDREWNRCVRNGRLISLLMIQIDHLEKIEDNRGYSAFEDTVRAVAAAINGELRRASDFLARYDRDKFVVMLPEADESDALVVAQQLRRRVEAVSTDIVDDMTVTISIGCCTRIPEVGQSAQAALVTAENNLYQANELGHNTVVVDCNDYQ